MRTRLFFAVKHPGRAVLIDGETTTLNSIAANLGFRLLPYGIAVWAASDTRARDGTWLARLTEDFADPTIMSAYATSPVDASHLVDQLQPAPIDRPSRKLEFPESPIPNVVAFKKALLEPFDDRMTDISAYNVSEGSVWQLEAVDGRAVVSYRCNVLHNHFFNGGRYVRQGDDNWMNQRRALETVTFRNVHRILSVPTPKLNPVRWRPVLSPLCEGFRESGLRGAARNAYIRIRQSQFSYIYKSVRNQGLYEYLFQTRISRRQRAAFRNLEVYARCGMVRSLFFLDTKTYDDLSYTVCGLPDRIELGREADPVVTFSESG